MTKVKLSKRDETLIDSLSFDRDETEKVTVSNPYSGESCELEVRGVALHDFIKGCEALRLYDKMQQALTLFRKLYPSEYYVLLD
jgi:hypothetical protein